MEESWKLIITNVDHVPESQFDWKNLVLKNNPKNQETLQAGKNLFVIKEINNERKKIHVFKIINIKGSKTDKRELIIEYLQTQIQGSGFNPKLSEAKASTKHSFSGKYFLLCPQCGFSYPILKIEDLKKCPLCKIRHNLFASEFY